MLFRTRDLTEAERVYLNSVEEALRDLPPAVRLVARGYAERLCRHDMPVLFDQAHLARVTGLTPQVVGVIRQYPDRFYSEFRIAKRDGGSRLLRAPTPALRSIQEWVYTHIVARLEAHDACHGFVPGRSIVTNARPHVGAEQILKLDIRDFFGRVDRRPVYRVFRRLGYSREVADLLTSMATYKGSLPQGAPTSPHLANLAAYRLDLRLNRFAELNGLTYTRYADDLTVSGQSVTQRKVRRTVELIMRDEGFPPNDKKVRYLGRDRRQAVTGIVVNNKPNWPRDRRRWLRQEIHFLKKFGVDGHLSARGIDNASYKEFIYGHVYALNSVRPDEARLHLEALDKVSWPY